MMLAPANKLRGFTLLELLVAIGVFSISILAFYGAFARAATLRSYAAEKAALVTTARNVMERIESDLRGAGDTGHTLTNLPLFVAPTPESRERGSDARLLLDFTTFSSRGVTAPEALWSLDDAVPDRGDQARVRWQLTERGELLRSELRPPRVISDREAPPPSSRFAQGVKIFEQRFYDGRQWVDRWDAAASPPTPSKLPLYVETRIVLASEAGTEFELVSTIAPPLAEPTP